jgi:EH domain-containing protein 1
MNNHQQLRVAETAETPTRASRLTVTSWFASIDSDNDGFITGKEARDFFSQSLVPLETLAHIWASFSKKRQGHLDENEFTHMFELTNRYRLARA